MLNEAQLIERELTLRSLRVTKEVMETRRSMVRWIALSIGVISPGESRLSALSVLDAMLHFQFVERRDPSVLDIAAYISDHWSAMNEKTLRYHLLQLKRMNMVANSEGRYSLVPPEIGDKYDCEAWISSYIDRETGPIKERAMMVIRGLRG
jgi:uncharacterized protein YbdZ (MbtH family)